MSFRIIRNNINDPDLIFDGGQPNKIAFKVKDEKQKVVCTLDLWAITTPNWQDMVSVEEKLELDNLFNFPRIQFMEIEEMVSHIEDGPIYLARCANQENEFFVYYTLFERQPSRYQCYVLAVIQREDSE